MYSLDTNAVIYYLSGEHDAVALITRAQEGGDVIYIPTIVRLELLSKKDITKDERTAILGFLETCRYVHLDIAVSDIAADIRRIYRLKTPDSIIAASALYTGTTLVTRNVKDFARVKEVRILGI